MDGWVDTEAAAIAAAVDADDAGADAARVALGAVPLLTLLLMCAARPQEALAAEVGHEDPRNGELAVRLLEAPFVLEAADRAEADSWAI